MNVNLKKEHEDGSATYVFDMTEDEQKAFFINGLKNVIDNDNVVVKDSSASFQFDSISESGAKNVFDMSEELYSMFIEEGILKALEAGLYKDGKNE